MGCIFERGQFIFDPLKARNKLAGEGFYA